MASPHVAGVVALVWASEPALTNVQVRQRLQDTAIDLGSPGLDTWYGYGLVYARNAAPPAIGITVYPSSIEYGTLALSPSPSSPVTSHSGAITITNNSSVAVNLRIYGSDATASGNTWTLAWPTREGGPTAVAYNAYMHKFALPPYPTPFASALTYTGQPLANNVAVGIAQEFELGIYMPTQTGSSEQHSTLVTIVATMP